MPGITNREFNIDAGILSSVVLLGGYRTASAADEDAPSVITLTGTVRDFRERTHPQGHPDFEVAPDRGYGLYCGNVGLLLGEDGAPVFTGYGRKITDQFRDAEGRPIAPHLANRRFVEGLSIEPVSCSILEDSRGRDAYEVCLVDAAFNEDGTSTWTYRVRETGAGRDLSHWNLKLDPSHEVMPGTTAGYDFGVDGSTGFHGIKWDVADGFTEGEFTIVLAGHFQGMNDDDGALAKGGRRHDTGAMFVPSTISSDQATPFEAGVSLVEDDSFNDSDGTMSYSSTGGIESADSFDSWYHDTLGVNMSKPLSLQLVRQDDGSYVFDDKEDPTFADLGGFFPIEDQLFGNPGGNPDRNFHFTLEMNTRFTYDADGDQIFKFIGDDDVWVFIDGKLAIDLGGVHSAQEQYIDLNRLGLEDGETYELDFFFAERHRTQSNFRIETNLELTSPRLPMMTAAFD